MSMRPPGGIPRCGLISVCVAVVCPQVRLGPTQTQAGYEVPGGTR